MCFNDLPDAEQQCETYIKKAFDICQTSVDAYQTVINLRTIQENFEEAKNYLNNIYNLVIKDIEDPELLPPYNNRYTLAKQAIALSQDEIAIDIMESLLNEDDTDPEIWFRMAQCYNALESNDVAIEYCSKCVEMLKILCKTDKSLTVYIFI